MLLPHYRRPTEFCSYYFLSLHDIKKRLFFFCPLLYILWCSCSIIVCRLVVYSCAINGYICTDEKCYMLFIVVHLCSMHIWILCAIFLFRKLYIEIKAF